MSFKKNYKIEYKLLVLSMIIITKQYLFDKKSILNYDTIIIIRV